MKKYLFSGLFLIILSLVVYFGINCYGECSNLNIVKGTLFLLGMIAGIILCVLSLYKR